MAITKYESGGSGSSNRTKLVLALVVGGAALYWFMHKTRKQQADKLLLLGASTVVRYVPQGKVFFVQGMWGPTGKFLGFSLFDTPSVMLTTEEKMAFTTVLNAALASKMDISAGSEPLIFSAVLITSDGAGLTAPHATK